MPKNGPFPSREAERNLYFQASVAHLVNDENAKRLGVSDENKAELKVGLDDWNRLYPMSQNPDMATRTITADKDTANDVLIESLRKVYADIPQSKLSTKDRAVLNLPLPSTTRTARPTPSTKPKGTVDTSKHLEHTIIFVDETTPTSRAKPEGVRGCQIWYKIGAPVVDPSELSYLATDTASPYTHHFNGADAGKTVYYWLRWENTRGEVGPWSDVIIATVPA